MTGFEHLVEDLLSEDKETRAVAHRRHIVEAVNRFLDARAPGAPCATMLWLFDHNKGSGAQDCTLWNYALKNWPIDTSSTRLHNVTKRIRGDDIGKSISAFRAAISIDENLFSTTGVFDGFPAPARDQLDERIISLEPHCAKDRERRFVGYLQIVARKDALDEINPSQLAIIGKLVFNRIAFGRRQRTVDALRKFQREIKPEMEYDKIIDAATECLGTYLTLERICVFDHAGARGAKKRNQSGPDRLKLPEITPWIGKFFAAERQKPQTNGVIRVSDFFTPTPENELIAPSLERGVVDPPAPNSAPIAVMLIPVYVGEADNPPLATIKVIGAAKDDFIGGAFSSTDEEIGEILKDYLAHLLPGVITYSRNQIISRRLDQYDETALLPGETDDKIYGVFPELITELLVNVDSAWAYVQTKEANGKVKTRWVSHKGENQHNPLSLSEEELDNLHGSGRELKGNLYLHAMDVIDSDETLRLYWTSRRPRVPDHDRLIVAQLASDMRLRAFGRLDVQALSRQIIDMRHAVKASMTGVIGHAGHIQEIFEDVKNEPMEVRDDNIFRRAEFRKAIESLMLSADISVRFLDVVRVLKRDLKRGDLKPRPSDPNAIAEQIIRMLRPFAARRGLNILLANRYPNTALPLPHFDPELMHVAMANLIENGAKYARRDTRVTVQIGVYGAEWWFYVEDVGRWIPEQDRDRIFEGDRLKTFKGETGQAGTGLGLAAVRRIVRAHDPYRGRDEVSSEKFDGTDPLAPTARTRIGFRLRRENLRGDH